MSSQDELLKNRFLELYRKAESCSYFTFTDFLGLSEQAIFAQLSYQLDPRFIKEFGGCEGCERIMLRFGSEEELGYSENFPISVIRAVPRAPKFADVLTHRDFLGALLNLGIERSTIGDIAILDNATYIFVKEEITDYIIANLTRAKHTELSLSITNDIPQRMLYSTKRVTVQVSGERLDAVIAKVFSLSRDVAQQLFAKKLVFAGGRECSSVSYTPKSGEIISVRGKGRFVYLGYETLSRKGKKNVEIDLFI